MRIAISILSAVLLFGCSNSSSSSSSSSSAASGSAAATAAPAKPAPAPAAPSGNASAQCGACDKFDACCAALAAIKDSGVDSSLCDGRAKTCAGFDGEVQSDMNQTCADRVAEWHKAHADVAACQ